MTDIEDLKRLAAAATPGPWTWWTSNSVVRLTGADGNDGSVLSAYKRQGYADIAVSDADREYIAAVDPQTLGSLITTIETQQRDIERINAGWDLALIAAVDAAKEAQKLRAIIIEKA